MSDIVIQVEDLHTSFFTRAGEVKAVDGVSFFVRQGETFGLVGESACGKTVTGLSLLRLLPEPAGKIVGGKIIFEGKNILELTKKQMRTFRGKMISMILQDPMTSLNPVFTVGIILQLGDHSDLEAVYRRQQTGGRPVHNVFGARKPLGTEPKLDVGLPVS